MRQMLISDDRPLPRGAVRIPYELINPHYVILLQRYGNISTIWYYEEVLYAKSLTSEKYIQAELVRDMGGQADTYLNKQSN